MDFQQEQHINFIAIPFPAKILKVMLARNNYTYGTLVNRAYVETETLELMTSLVNLFNTLPNIEVIDDIEKIIYDNSNITHYRQRIFFRSFIDIIEICKEWGLYLYFPNEFHLRIRNVLSINHPDLNSLDNYAKEKNLDIDSFLNISLMYQIYLVLLEYSEQKVATNIVKLLTDYCEKHRYFDIIPYIQYPESMSLYLKDSPYFIYNYDLTLHLEEIYYWDKTDDMFDIANFSGYTKEKASKKFKDLWK